MEMVKVRGPRWRFRSRYHQRWEGSLDWNYTSEQLESGQGFHRREHGSRAEDGDQLCRGRRRGRHGPRGRVKRVFRKRLDEAGLLRTSLA